MLGTTTLHRDIDTERTDFFNMPSWDIALCQLFSVVVLYNFTMPVWPIDPLSSCGLADKFQYQPLVHFVFYLARRLLLPPIMGGQQLKGVCTLNHRNRACCSLEASWIPCIFLYQERVHIDPLRLVLSAGSFSDLAAPWVLNSPFFPSSLRSSSP